MTTLSPTFDPQEFELRDYTSDWLNPEQAEAVALVESRTKGQLDWVAQFLGWAPSPNYWTNLPDTVDQKRQLLGGSFGVYNSFSVADVLEVRNWDDTVVITQMPGIQPGQRAFLGLYSYTVESVSMEGNNLVVSFGALSEQFLADLSANEPLRIDVRNVRPAPFNRPLIGVSGDAEFVVGVNGSALTLYPAYDTQKTLPYKFPILMEGATYYFDQRVSLSYDGGPANAATCSYDQDRALWYFSVPRVLSPNQTEMVACLSLPVTGGDALLPVLIQQWSDPSDWNSENVLKNFIGAWGNKGGALPFNLAFDSLSIHGFSEVNSLFLPEVNREISFDSLLNFVYYQTSRVSNQIPDPRYYGQTWWNSETGALSIWYPSDSECSRFWVEIDYRIEPVNQDVPDRVFSSVADFEAEGDEVDTGILVQINDITGLSLSSNVLGIQGELQSPGQMLAYRNESGYWVPQQIQYANVAGFSLDAPSLPFKVPVTIINGNGLEKTNSTFRVTNLDITITGNYEVVLVKRYNNTAWSLIPDSLLKYIGDTRTFAAAIEQEEGDMFWDYANSEPDSRFAGIFYDDVWVAVNSNDPEGVPSPPPAPGLPGPNGVLLVHCNGSVLESGVTLDEDSFALTYTFDPAKGTLHFNFVPKDETAVLNLPKIRLSDNITTAFTYDITNLVFSGVQYYMSPNVLDCKTPLRLWKAQEMQVAETLAHLAEDNYYNALVADQNTGPGQENWERYFVRMPADYSRNETAWQKANLICQNFAYWGSSSRPELMECPPEDDTPLIYEELYLFQIPLQNFKYVYCEPYLYSNIAYPGTLEEGEFYNSAYFPAVDTKFDGWSEAHFQEYEPLHNRRAIVDLPVGEGYGDWEGTYVSTSECSPLSGFFVNDLYDETVGLISPPIWDASIFKIPPTCQNSPESYTADANHYKVGYAYFAADLSAAEDGFFDVTQEAAWRYPVKLPRTSYVLPRG